MRLEETIAQALDNVGGDKYLLSVAIAKRAEELRSGSSTKLNINAKNYKDVDLALMEIATNAIKVQKYKDLKKQ